MRNGHGVGGMENEILGIDSWVEKCTKNVGFSIGMLVVVLVLVMLVKLCAIGWRTE